MAGRWLAGLALMAAGLLGLALAWPWLHAAFLALFVDAVAFARSCF